MTGTRNRRRLLPVLFLDGGLYDHLANASQYGPGQATELVPAHWRPGGNANRFDAAPRPILPGACRCIDSDRWLGMRWSRQHG